MDIMMMNKEKKWEIWSNKVYDAVLNSDHEGTEEEADDEE